LQAKLDLYQGNKISSVRPGTINIELGLDLYVLYIYYKGPKKCK